MKIPQIIVCFSAGDCDWMGTGVRRWRIRARLAKGPVAPVVGQHVSEHIQQCGLRRLHQPMCVVRRWIEGTRGRLLSSTIITLYVYRFIPCLELRELYEKLRIGCSMYSRKNK